MPETAIIRAAKPGDKPSILRLISLFPDTLLQEHLPRIPSFFVAESRGEIVGCCALQIYSKRLSELRSLAVHPGYQNAGIASSLVEACRSRARERGIQQVFTVTSEPHFFERNGFAVHSGWKTALFFDLD